MTKPSTQKITLRDKIKELKSKESKRENKKIENSRNERISSNNFLTKWVNHNSPRKDSLSVPKSINKDTNKLLKNLENDDLEANNKLKLSNKIYLLNNKQNHSREKNIHKFKNEISRGKNFKNHSYGIGDNLQKLISDNKPTFNTVKFENSFIIQPDLQNKMSPSRSRYEEDSSGNLHHQILPENRFSMNKSYYYDSNQIGLSRSSVPLQNLNDSRLNRLNDHSSTMILEKKSDPIKSNKWKNYQFLNNEMNNVGSPIVNQNESKQSKHDNSPSSSHIQSPPLHTQMSPLMRVLNKETNKSSNEANSNVLMSINIKQLPGLKESHSTGKLHLPKTISHIKNRSNNFSNDRLRSNSQLRKFIDSNGNVRYRLMNNIKASEPDSKDSLVKKYQSVTSQVNKSYDLRKSNF
jgi:hypothetical protein